MARPTASRRSAAEPNSATTDTRPERSRGRTRKRILDAAARTFRLQGNTARLADIAQEAGIQTGSLYYHFANREALVEEVLNLGLEFSRNQVQQALAAAPEDATAGDRLAIALAAHAASVLETSDYSAANSRIFALATDEVRARHYELQRDYGTFFHALYQDAIDSGELRADVDPTIIRMLLFGAMNWAAEWFRPGRGRSGQQVIDQLMALAVDGLWVDGAGPSSGNFGT